MYEPILMSQSSFDKLSADQQKALMAAGQMAEDYFFTQAKVLDQTMVDKFKEAGVEVVTMSADEAAKWRKIANETSYKAFSEKSAERRQADREGARRRLTGPD